MKFIKDNYMNMSSSKIAKILNRNSGNIEQKAREMGFVKQEKWIKKECKKAICFCLKSDEAGAIRPLKGDVNDKKWSEEHTSLLKLMIRQNTNDLIVNTSDSAISVSKVNTL